MSCQCTCNIASQEYELDNTWFWIILLSLSFLSIMQIITYITEDNDLMEIYTVEDKDAEPPLTTRDMMIIRKDVIGYFENGFFKPPRTPFEILLQTFYMAVHVLLEVHCTYRQYPIRPLFHKVVGSRLTIDYIASGDEKPYFICGMPEIFLRMYYRSVYTLFQIHIDIGQRRCSETINRNKEPNFLRVQSALFRSSFGEEVKALPWNKIEEKCVDQSDRSGEGLLVLLEEEQHKPGVCVRIQGSITSIAGEVERINCFKPCGSTDVQQPCTIVCRVKYLQFQHYSEHVILMSNMHRQREL